MLQDYKTRGREIHKDWNQLLSVPLRVSSPLEPFLDWRRSVRWMEQESSSETGDIPQ